MRSATVESLMDMFTWALIAKMEVRDTTFCTQVFFSGSSWSRSDQQSLAMGPTGRIALGAGGAAQVVCLGLGKLGPSAPPRGYRRRL